SGPGPGSRPAAARRPQLPAGHRQLDPWRRTYNEPGKPPPGLSMGRAAQLSSARRSAPALLPDPDADLDRGALEGERLPQPPLDEPPVAGIEEPGGEQHEPGRAGVSLGAEQDARLLPAPHRVRMGCGELTKKGVQPAG